METANHKPELNINALRRRLFRGVPAGLGVLLAVQAKTALGTTVCQSPSAKMSGNTSPRPGGGSTCSGGLSPGYWKVPQKFSSWGPAGATYPTFKKGVDACSSGMKNLTLDNILTHGTSLITAGFTGAAGANGYVVTTSTGIWAPLAFPGSFANGQLLRHLCAAWLNAGYFQSSSQQYPLTRAQVIAMWNATKSGGTYCPSGVTCSQPWTATDVINYIEGMYDFNSSDGDPTLCQQA